MPNEFPKKITVHSLRPPRVLLVEDDEDIAFVVGSFLKLAGYACYVKLQTTDIIGLVENCQPDLILLDYLLPSVNGGELCSEIKRSPSYQHLPVIIYSAYPKVLLSLGNYRCDAFIPKPFDLNKLVSTIEENIGARHLLGQLQKNKEKSAAAFQYNK